MQVTGNNSSGSISVRVALSGYVSRTESNGVSDLSAWMSADRFFTDARFRRRYDEVKISVFTPKFTLVPEQFFDPLKMRELLSEVTSVSEDDYVTSESLPGMKSVLVFSNEIGETLSRAVSDTVLKSDGSKSRILPEMWQMLADLGKIPEYNKVLAACADGRLYMAVAQGRSLLLCNSYPAADFTTAEYYIFSAMKKLQLNIEMSAIYFRTPLDAESEMSLYRYFRSVDYL